MSSKFWYYSFVAVSGDPGGKVPVVDVILSSHEQNLDPTTLINKNCIGFEFQTDCNYYIDLRQTYLAFKLKFVKGHGYETCNTKEVEKEHKEEAKVDEDTAASAEEEQ